MEAAAMEKGGARRSTGSPQEPAEGGRGWQELGLRFLSAEIWKSGLEACTCVHSGDPSCRSRSVCSGGRRPHCSTVLCLRASHG